MNYVNKIKEIGNGSEVQIYENTIVSGEWRNEAKDAHHININNASVVNAEVTTQLQNYLAFNGIDQVAYTADNAELRRADTNVTFGFFVYYPTTTNTDADVVFSKHRGDIAGHEYRHYNTNREIQITPDGGLGANWATPPIQEWMFVSIVKDAGTTSHYKRQLADTSLQLLDTTTATWVDGDTAPFKFGARGDIGSFIRHGEFRISGFFSANSAFTTAQIDQIYDSAFTVDPINLPPVTIGANLIQGAVVDYYAYDNYDMSTGREKLQTVISDINGEAPLTVAVPTNKFLARSVHYDNGTETYSLGPQFLNLS